MDVAMRRQEEGGFVLLALLSILVPMLLVVGIYSVSMTGQTNLLQMEQDDGRALLAAEAGINEAIYQAEVVNLFHGVTFTRTLAPDLSFVVTPTRLSADGLDNDGDGTPDESDENVFQVTVTGTYRSRSRTLVAFLGPVSLLPWMDFAFGVMDQSVTLDFGTAGYVSGWNTKISGGTATPDVAGLAILDPGTPTYLLGELNATEQANVTGLGVSPSLATTTSFTAPEIQTLLTELHNVADITLTSNAYSSYVFGSGIAAIAHVTYREGDLAVSPAGTMRGAGILVVNGDLIVSGQLIFDGVLIVTGDLTVTSSGLLQVYGSVLHSGSRVQNTGVLLTTYSSEAIALANSRSGKFSSFNGWQELNP